MHASEQAHVLDVGVERLELRFVTMIASILWCKVWVVSC